MSSDGNGPRGDGFRDGSGQQGRHEDKRGRGVVDRRLWPDRRNTRVEGQQPPPPTGLERRRGPGRRLSDFARSAEEGEMTREQFLFLMAIEQFKKANQVTFPTWTDVLEVIRLLGYRKTMPMEVNVSAAEDWREAPDTPSGVRTERQWQRQREAERRFGEGREAA